ncbi:hypothetical protein OIU78_018833 [Salix suchowensis]|nr:hypothetical protein OIU78_018833 [Salix suchowensis]
MPESCNSRHFSWLMKSCFPNPQDPTSKPLSPNPIITISIPTATTLYSLSDDLLLECLSRVPSSSLPSVSLVCRRWSLLLHSPSFLYLRRLHHLIHPTIFTLSAPFAASLRLPDGNDANTDGPLWKCSRGKIYVAGGGSRAGAALEEYDPETDTWRVVAHARRRRFGCIGAAVDGVFYVIGGLKIGAALENEVSRAAAAGAEAYVYASTMDLFDVESRAWLRSRAVPGGGCAVAACAVAGRGGGGGGGGSGKGFGEWCKIKNPPLPAQVRLDSTVRRSGRNVRGLKEGLVLVYDCVSGEWSRGPHLPEVIRRAACVTVEC